MKWVGVVLVAAGLMPAPAGAQSVSPLTLDDAVALALVHSRTVVQAGLVEARAREELAVTRTRHLPSLSVASQVSRLLRPVDITFPAGAFGTFPETGPVPASDTAVRTPARVSLLVNATASQPLTGLRRTQIAVQSDEAALALAQEDTRASRLAVVRDVKRTYYAIQQARAALDAALASERLLMELDAVVADRIAQRVALKSDGLDVLARRAELDLTTLRLRHAITAQTERLNHLMGRDPAAPLDVAPVPALASVREVAGTTAADSRPDVRQARLRVTQAGLAVRDAALDRWPEADLALQSVTPVNIDGAPRNITSVALRLSWEPFDWGRRARIRAARQLDVQRAADAAAETASAARLEINAGRRAVEDAQLALRVAATARTAAEEQARVRTTQYRVRAVLLSDVLQAHAVLADRSARHDQALLTLFDARANLDYALGEDILP